MHSDVDVLAIYIVPLNKGVLFSAFVMSRLFGLLCCPFFPDNFWERLNSWSLGQSVAGLTSLRVNLLGMPMAMFTFPFVARTTIPCEPL